MSTEDPTDAEQEKMAKKQRRSKSLGKAKLSLAIVFLRNYGIVWFKRKHRRFTV